MKNVWIVISLVFNTLRNYVTLRSAPEIIEITKGFKTQHSDSVTQKWRITESLFKLDLKS